MTLNTMWTGVSEEFKREYLAQRGRFTGWWLYQIHRARPQWWVVVSLILGLFFGLVFGRHL